METLNVLENKREVNYPEQIRYLQHNIKLLWAVLKKIQREEVMKNRA